MEVKVKVWLEDDNQNIVFGSGKNELLKSIALTGSISQTASKVGMNYKKAWSHIQVLENLIEDKLVVTQRGRGNNSGSTLTPKAEKTIELFDTLNEDIKKYANKRFEELFLENKEDLINLKEDND